ncbi:DUF4113 domain-containing protein [Pantoea agglomerans]
MINETNKSRLGKVWFAGESIDNQWKMKLKMLSLAYPTRWTDVPIAR